MPINHAKKRALVIAVYAFFVNSPALNASQAPQAKALTKTRHQKESVYCSALQCWSHKPCFQHPQNNAQSVRHDAQRWLPQQVLYIIGLYALPEHTHTIGRIVPGALLNEAGIFIDKQPVKVGWHFLADRSYFTHIKPIEASEGTIARILLANSAEQNLFRQGGAFTAGKRLDESDYVIYRRALFDDSLAIEAIGSGSGVCRSTMHLVPAPDKSILEQASFLEYDSKVVGKKKN